MQPWAFALGLVLLLNVLFIAAAVGTALLPREHYRERLRDAFAAGMVTDRDWLSYDTRRGVHQYDECLIFHMLTNDAEPLLAAALGPIKYVRGETFSNYCRTLRELVVAGADPAEYNGFAYTRYWHGYLPITAAFLAAADLGTARRMLHVAAYASLLLLLFLSLRAHGLLRVVGAGFAVTGLSFWGLPYYGQLFAHAPGDILIVLATALLIAAATFFERRERIIVFSAAYGALVVYLEFLTGQLPTAAAFLFAAAYAIGTRHEETATGLWRLAGGRAGAWRLASTAIVAFALGGIITVALKQLLVLAVFGAHPAGSFFGNLAYYTEGVPSSGRLPEVLRPFSALYYAAPRLAHGNGRVAQAVLGAAVLCWSAAFLVAGLRARTSSTTLHDVLALALAAGVIVAWVLLFQTHTFYHARRFMVRMLVVPVALGVAAAVWSLLRWRTDTPRDAPEVASTPPAGV